MLPQFSNILQLVQKFSDEKTCNQYLATRRWDGYMECPYAYCDGDKAYVFKDGIRYKCSECRKVYTARTGTIFEGSKLSLLKWFMAIYLIMHKKGISSVQLAKDIGVTQKTAWFMLQRIRKAFGNEKIQKLQGIVELDESYVGGKNGNRHKDKKATYGNGRRFNDKVPVFGMLERGGKVIATAIHKPSKQIIKPIIYKCIHMGTTLMTDEFNVYKDLKTNFHLLTCNHGKGIYGKGHIYTNSLENFWSHMKRGLKGVYHQVSPKHLNKYVQEFVFKYNYRNLDIQEQFNVLIGNMNCRLKYKDLIA